MLDIAAGLAALGQDDRAVGQVWHLPGPETGTTRTLLDLLTVEVGHPIRIRSVPKLLMSALGLVNPMMRGLPEMAYQFDEPFLFEHPDRGFGDGSLISGSVPYGGRWESSGR